MNYIVDKLLIKLIEIAILEFDFLNNYRVFAIYKHRLNKAKFYYKRRSRKNSVLIKRYR